MVTMSKSYIIYEAVQRWGKDWPGGSRSVSQGQVMLPLPACVLLCKAKGGAGTGGMCGTDNFWRCLPGQIAENSTSARPKEGE